MSGHRTGGRAIKWNTPFRNGAKTSVPGGKPKSMLNKIAT